MSMQTSATTFNASFLTAGTFEGAVPTFDRPPSLASGVSARAPVLTSDEFFSYQKTGTAAISERALRNAQRLDEIQKQLVEIESALYEDYGISIDRASKSGYERFMSYHSGATLPLLAAESTGKLVATWLVGAECLTLRFQRPYHFQFALAFYIDGTVSRAWDTGNTLTFLDEQPVAKQLVYGRR
jgi:hypothetical protein